MTEPRNGDMATTRGSRPVPDPTELTDKAIAKVVSALTDYIDGEIKNTNTRIDGAVKLTDERFQAAERLRIEQKKDTKDAVDAALSAAKEAVKEQTTSSERSIDKSEKSTGEILTKQQETFDKAIEGLSDKIDDLKERIGRVESEKVGGTAERTSIFAIIGLVLAVAAFVVGRLS